MNLTLVLALIALLLSIARFAFAVLESPLFQAYLRRRRGRKFWEQLIASGKIIGSVKL